MAQFIITNITRNRDVYYFHRDTDDKTININVTNPACIGWSGKQVAYSARTYANAHDLANLLLYPHNSDSDIIEILNRLISYPFDNSYRVYLTNAFARLFQENSRNRANLIIKEILNDWKTYLAYLIEQRDTIFQHNWTFQFIWQSIKEKKLEDVVTRICKDRPLLAKNLVEYIHHLFSWDYNCKDFWATHFEKAYHRHPAFRRALTDIFYTNPIRRQKMQEKIFQALGTNDPDVLDYYGIRISNTRCNDDDHLLDKMVDMITWLEKMENETFAITNIKDDYSYLKAVYNRKELEITNRAFKKNQEHINLEYELGDFSIYVPKSRQELQDIGDFFHNCANGHEWRNYLEDGYRYLVVVSQNGVFKVCCDIDCTTNQIIQYLAPYNARVREPDLLEFKQAYQNYLLTL